MNKIDQNKFYNRQKGNKWSFFGCQLIIDQNEIIFLFHFDNWNSLKLNY